MPHLGKSNFHVDIPYRFSPYKTPKTIDYVELSSLSTNLSVILEPKVELVDFRQIDVLGAYYKGTDSENFHLATYNVPSDDDGGEVRYKSYVVQNIPFYIGEFVEVTAHYNDGSLAREIISIPDVGTGVLPRKYYTIKVGDLDNYLGTNGEGALVLQGNNNLEQYNWLIEEYQGLYILLNKQSNKVLGLVDGELGTYEWDPQNLSLFWSFEFEDNYRFRLINPVQQGFFNTTEGDNPIPEISFTKASLLTLNISEEAPPIWSEELKAILNKNTYGALEISQQGYPHMIGTHSEVENEDSPFTIRLEYNGALHYFIYHSKEKKYLNVNNSNTLGWDSERKTHWLIDTGQPHDDYFTISSSDWFLSSTWDDGIHVKSGDNLQLTDDEHQFRLFTEFGGPIAHYRLDNNTEDSTEYDRHASSYGGVTFVEDTERGFVAKFDGSDDYIDLNDNFNHMLYEGDLTISLWMKTDGWSKPHEVLIGGQKYGLRRKIVKIQLLDLL